MRLALVVKHPSGSFSINFDRKFARELSGWGVETTILAGVEGNKAATTFLATDKVVKEIHVSYPSVSLHTGVGIVSYPSWIVDDLLFARTVARTLGKGYDVVQCDNPLWIRYFRRIRVPQPLIYQCINGYLLEPNLMALRDRLLTRYYHSPTELQAALAADYTACMNEQMERFFRERSIDTSKLRIIPPIATVDTDLFRPAEGGYREVMEKYGTNGRCTLVFVGRLSPIKGVDTLLKATALLLREGYVERIRVLIVGPFSDIQGYTGQSSYALALLKFLGGSDLRKVVRFTGPLDHNALSKLLASSDILVLPSRLEGLGVVLLEAMSCGLPVVGSRVGGIPSVIKEGENGFMFDPMNPRELAEKLKLLIDDRVLRKRLGALGREMAVTKYALKVAARRYASLYMEATGTKRM